MGLSELSPGFGQQESYTGTCDTHGQFIGQRTQLLSRQVESGCPTCSRERVSRQEAEDLRIQQEAMQRRFEQKRREAGIPLRFDDRTFESFVADTQGRAKAKASVQALVQAIQAGERGHNLILVGKPGTGKSHLCCAAVHELFSTKKVRRIELPELIRNIRNTWRKGSELTEDEVLEYYGASLDLLIIEEVGTSTGSEDEKSRVFAVLNRRYENCLPTVIVTNLGKEALAAELGDRVMDRLREGRGVLVPFDWESARK